ncbi:MAG: peptidylprolyl isomerase [Moorea sp. SIOASIH]|uniref:peptidylprolyl isomerase n=1 Tax=Moorena sp. SIOASIH TaxID=2607817 RepID=UPI0013B8C428|nr:peptidylprolyl isomerase [Moorena sp. SIOASIH]NEO35943.1 peptidylprolyl isomerase [Moorena sp. SIOASIH]
MQSLITIDQEALFEHARLSCQIPTLLEGIVTCKIIESAAAEAGIQVEPEELQQAADDFRLATELHNTDETWSWLQQHHLSLDDFEALIYTNTIADKVAQHLFKDQVESFFYEHQLDYAGVVMYEVVLEDEDLGWELFYAFKEGEISFHEIARQYIQDVSLRRSGGYRGILQRQQLKPEIAAAVFAASPPQILQPIVTSSGVHLILVEEIIQPQLDEQLRSEILSDLFSDWLKEQLEQIEIVAHL